MARQRLQSDPANKRLFSHPRMAADLVRLLGDPWIDDLDLDRMERLPTEYVSEDLRNRRADLPWWAPFKPGTGHPAGAGVMFHIEYLCLQAPLLGLYFHMAPSVPSVVVR